MSVVLRNDKTKQSASFDTKNTFVGVQTDVEMTTSKKNTSQMIDMNVPLLGMSR